MTRAAMAPRAKVFRRRGLVDPTDGEHKETRVGINKDQVEGQVNVAKGTLKETAGKVVGNPTLEAKGTLQKGFGKVQRAAGKVEQALEDDAKKGG